MAATVTAEISTANISLERLRVAQDALQGIDLRTLRGDARTDVKEARVRVADAVKSVRG
jgi:hypothetical protein